MSDQLPLVDSPWAVRLRRGVGSLVVDNLFRGAAMLGRLHPRAAPERHGVRVTRDVAYAPTGRIEHRLDVYEPVERKGEKLPVVLYVHGGGFRILSKDTHWVMGLAFARAGFLVFNISYRLAPRDRFPAAVEDCATAYAWVCENAARYGGDLSRLVLAGESAGANLVTALTVLACYPRPEPWTKRVYDSGVMPRAFLPYCGMLQVSDAERFLRRKPGLSPFINDRVLEVAHSYLGRDLTRYGSTLDLADPLCVIERDAPERPLPACLATCGTADPILHDTRRLADALRKHGSRCEDIYYPGEPHAFHALVWRPQARRCWEDTFRFLESV
jgi:acetyl esterase